MMPKDLKQTRLFEQVNPLTDRLGEEFFSNLPKTPGIYKMYNRPGNLIYVGKAKNLRNRLFTYRRVKKGNASRKTVRLVRAIHRIEYERHDTEKEALLRENELIRNFRPEFNRAKKQPDTYYFIQLELNEKSLVSRLGMSWDGSPENCYGSFKGHNLVRRSLGAFLRMCYILEHSVESPFELPSVLLRNLTPLNYRLHSCMNNFSPARFWSDIDRLFKGASDEFIYILLEEFEKRKLLESFMGTLILEDLEYVQRFFERCAQRNYRIKEKLGLSSHIVPQEKLDDYLVELAL